MPGDESESGVALVVLLFALLPADGDLGGVLLQRGFGPVDAICGSYTLGEPDHYKSLTPISGPK